MQRSFGSLKQSGYEKTNENTFTVSCDVIETKNSGIIKNNFDGMYLPVLVLVYMKESPSRSRYLVHKLLLPGRVYSV